MKNFRSILIIVAIVFASNLIFAASPLIKASFYEAYQSNEIVQHIEKHGMLDGKVAAFLMDENNFLGEKAAVINALPWDEKNKESVDTYKMYLGRKYGVGYKDLKLTDLSGDELLCLGYMMLLDENIEIAEAQGVLESAIEKNTQSYVTNLIYALTSAQIHLNDRQNCDAWTICNSIRTNAAFTKDINDQAISLIYQEVDVYKSSCN